MKVLSLLGSFKKKGKTATILGIIEDELQALGHEVDRVFLSDHAISGCRGCATCRRTDEPLACVQKDDALPLLHKMLAADAVIYASPLYFWGFSAQMKAFIDRGYCLVKNYGKPDHFSLVEGQSQALLVTAADDYEDNGEAVVAAFKRMVEYNKARSAGELFVGRSGERDLTGPDITAEAKALARRLAGNDKT